MDQTPRGADRRTTHRRANEAAFHYAEAALVQAALNVADAQVAAVLGRNDPERRQELSRAITDASTALRRAAIVYRETEAGLDVPRGTVTTEPVR